MYFKSEKRVQEIYKNFKANGGFLFCNNINASKPIHAAKWNEVLDEIGNIRDEAYDVIKYLNYNNSIEFKFDLIDYLRRCSSIQKHSKYKIIIDELTEELESINKKRTFDLNSILKADSNSDINTNAIYIVDWNLKTSENWKRKLKRYLKNQIVKNSMLIDILDEEIELIERIYSDYIRINSLISRIFSEGYSFDDFNVDFVNYSNNIFLELKNLEILSIRLSLAVSNTDKKKWDNTKHFFLLVIDEFIKYVWINHNNDFKKTNFFPQLKKNIELLNNVNSDIFQKTDIMDEIPLEIQNHPDINKTTKIALHILVRDIKNDIGSKTELNKIYHFLKTDFSPDNSPSYFKINFSDYKNIITRNYNLNSTKKVNSLLKGKDRIKFQNLLSESGYFS